MSLYPRTVRFFSTFVVVTLLILLMPGNGYSSDSLKVSRKNELAPNFYLFDLEGQSHFLNDYCGKKKNPLKKSGRNVVLLNFFASWCVPCRNEFPILDRLSERFTHDSLKIFLINVEETPPVVRSYVRKMGIKLPVLLDRYGVVKQKYSVWKIPRIVLIDPDQKIVFDHEGFDPKEPLFQILSTKIERLLKKHHLR